jgi:hypothetical protein
MYYIRRIFWGVLVRFADVVDWQCYFVKLDLIECAVMVEKKNWQNECVQEHWLIQPYTACAFFPRCVASDTKYNEYPIVPWYDLVAICWYYMLRWSIQSVNLQCHFRLRWNVISFEPAIACVLCIQLLTILFRVTNFIWASLLDCSFKVDIQTFSQLTCSFSGFWLPRGLHFSHH